MGIFTKRTIDEHELRTDALIKSLSTHADMYMRKLSEWLVRLKKDPQEGSIMPSYLYTEIIEMLMANTKNFSTANFEDALTYGEKIYKEIFIYEEETPGFDDLELVFIELFDENSAVYKKCFNTAFFNLFHDKHNYIKWLRAIAEYMGIDKLNNYLVSYGTAARSYYSDEEMFTANIIGFTLKLIKAVDQRVVYEEELKNIEHMVGIYNVDEARILSAEQHLNAVEELVVKANDILGMADERLRSIDAVTKTSVEKVKQYCDTEVSTAQSELTNLHEQLQRSHDEFITEQRKVILYDKQMFMKEVFAEAEDRIKTMQTAAQTVVTTANSELLKFSKESDLAMTKLEQYLQNDQRFQQMLSDASVSEELMNKVEKLMMLSSHSIDQVGAGIGENRTDTKVVQAGELRQIQTQVVDEVVTVADDQEIQSVAFLLDDNIPFQERFKEAMKRKKKLQEAGEHFHMMFDDVLTAVMENANPYLVGPSGCGKTYMIGQIARILQVDFVDIGYINEEYDILGFQTANGGYSRPNFYRCYKYGKIAFCDELDNGNARATVKLNSFLANTSHGSYNFPNGEHVERHPNFRIISAGNTVGNGADSNYNTREKIEESVQQRLLPIHIGYDNAVEKKILGKYEDWYGFVVLFRQATDAWGKGNYSTASGIITTRDTARIRKYVDNGSFSTAKILEYEFVQTKDIGYLAFLSNYFNKHMPTDKGVAKLAQQFTRIVDERRKKEA